MQNSIHIETARAALARAAWVQGEAPAYSENSITDLIMDIRHLCAASGLDFDWCDRVAAMHYEAETGGAL